MAAAIGAAEAATGTDTTAVAGTAVAGDTGAEIGTMTTIADGAGLAIITAFGPVGDVSTLAAPAASTKGQLTSTA